MKKAFITTIFVLVIGAPLGLYSLAKFVIAPYEGVLTMSSLESKVTITRDRWGIAHIEAENEFDLQRGLGFAMASDRLFQMDLLRRVANGELSEIFGSKMLKHDIFLRKLRLRKSADEFFNKKRHLLEGRMIKLVEAFYEGVHHYMQTQPLPIEFQVLGYRPRAFRIEEAMAVSGYLSLSFAEGLIADPLFSDLLNHFPADLVDLMRIRHRNDKNIVTQSMKEKKQEAVSFQLDENLWYSDFLETHDLLRDRFGLFHGSNSWVVAGNKSQSGHPLLANDPHVAFSNPGIWYEAHLRSPDYEVYGHYIPVIPFPSMGHNTDRAWAVTMSEVDDIDLYQEKIHPDDPTRVMYREEWVEMKSYQEKIKVRGEKDKIVDVFITPHGPLINKTKYEVKGKDVSIKWSYHHPENNIAMAFYKLAHTKKLEDLSPALSYAGAPGLNISWVDKEGNIAWKVMGKIPLREGFRGHQILEGWSGKHEYSRYLTIDENPGLINPESGVIVTANYRPLYNGPFPIDGYWQPSERLERIHELLLKKEKWSIEEFKKIQFDQFVANGSELIKELLKECPQRIDPFEAKVHREISNWDGGSSVESVGSSIFHMWIYHVGREALIDELGEKRYIAYNKVSDFWNHFKSFIKVEDSPLWDDTRTPQKESRGDIIRRAFKITSHKLKSRLGEDISQWKWGRLHTVTFQHPLGKVKPLNQIFDIGPFPAGGGQFQIDNMSTARYLDTFEVRLGPSSRRLIDMQNPSYSLNILPTGNSGQILSPYNKNQADLFLKGKYRPQWMNLEDVKRYPHKVLKLNPS
jgi:penicillin G amidase